MDWSAGSKGQSRAGKVWPQYASWRTVVFKARSAINEEPQGL